MTAAADILATLWRGDPGEIVVASNVDAADHLARRLRRLAPAWTVDAACRDEPTSTFFPERGQTNTRALAICARCPARIECLNEAIADQTLDFGIRGGATAQARRIMRINRQRTQRTEPT